MWLFPWPFAYIVWSFALPGHPVAMMMFKTWGYIVSKMLSFYSSLQPTLLIRPCFKHSNLRPILNSVIIWKVSQSAATNWSPSLTFFVSCSQGHVLESSTSSIVLLISLIDVEVRLGCSHCCRWNSAARRSSMDVHQYSVIYNHLFIVTTLLTFTIVKCVRLHRRTGEFRLRLLLLSSNWVS